MTNLHQQLPLLKYLKKLQYRQRPPRSTNNKKPTLRRTQFLKRKKIIKRVDKIKDNRGTRLKKVR